MIQLINISISRRSTSCTMITTNTFGSDLSDDSNADSDESTDKYLSLVWGNMMPVWAGGTDPHTLANLKFKVAEGADLTLHQHQ